MDIPFSHLYVRGKSLLVFDICITPLLSSEEELCKILDAAKKAALRQKLRFHEAVLVVESREGRRVVGDERLSRYVKLYGPGPLDSTISVSTFQGQGFRFEKN
jgi:hypothetical protein